MKRIFCSLLLSLMLLPAVAQAVVVSVQGTPGVVNVNSRGNTVVTVRWTVQVIAVDAGTQVRSPTGDLIGGGGVFQSPGGVLSRIAPTGNGTAPTTLRFTERVVISRAAVNEILQGNPLVYQRTFSDEDNDETSTVNIAVTGSGGLSFQFGELLFDDDSRYRVIDTDTELTARLRLTTSGRGVLNGTWQIAGPSGNGIASFRPIAPVRQVLAGSRRTVFESPSLPTDRPGLYVVRFSPTETVRDPIAETFGEIRYVVTASPGRSGIDLLSPIAGVTPTAATRFAWSSVDGADRYRVEFLIAGSIGSGGTRVAAIDVAAPDLATSLKPFTLARMRQSGARLWRVVALDATGRPLAASALRDLGSGAALGVNR